MSMVDNLAYWQQQIYLIQQEQLKAIAVTSIYLFWYWIFSR